MNYWDSHRLSLSQFSICNTKKWDPTLPQTLIYTFTKVYQLWIAQSLCLNAFRLLKIAAFGANCWKPGHVWGRHQKLSALSWSLRWTREVPLKPQRVWQVRTIQFDFRDKLSAAIKVLQPLLPVICSGDVSFIYRSQFIVIDVQHLNSR